MVKTAKKAEKTLYNKSSILGWPYSWIFQRG